MSHLIAKLEGGGYERPDADKGLPIDINYAKLNEWLVDRKQVPADWGRRLQAIQAKAAEAVGELPPGFLGQFDGGEDAAVDYFLAQQVLSNLSETAEKGFLGSFKGAAGSWDKVIKAYEYNLIYLAEAAQTLSRNADYEIPFFKKQAAKYQQQLGDLERRKAEALKSAAAAAAEFRQECQHMGIDSSNIRAGLLGLTSELPALAGTAVDALQAEPISQALHYYTAVVGIQEGGATAAAAAPSLLPVLQEVREGRTAPPPRASAAGTAAAGGEAGGNGDLEVDWDLGAALEGVGGDDVSTGDMAGPAGTISWDLDVADLAVGGEGGDAAAPADISWEVEVEALAAVADVDTAPAGGDASSAPAQVSWDIDISGVGEDTTTAEETFAPSSAAAANCGAAEAAAAAAAAAEADEPATVRRLVEDASYRARLLDDLYELRAFLKQRVRELGGKSSDLLVASAAEAVQAVSADEAAAMLAGVEGALAAWGGDKLKQLVALRTSARYLDRLTAGLQQKAGQEAKFQRAAADAEGRRGDLQRQLMADSAKLAALVKRTRRAKEEVERALSAKLGRRINIQGEINQLL